MAHATVVYKLLIEHQGASKWVDVEIVLDQKSKSKTKNRSRAAALAREQYPGCNINQIIYESKT
jgi:hypothetical protein